MESTDIEKHDMIGESRKHEITRELFTSEKEMKLPFNQNVECS